MNKPTKVNGTIHPIYEGVNPKHWEQLTPERTLLVLNLRKDGYSYTQIARRLYAEHGIELSSQQAGRLCKQYFQKFMENGGK